MEIVGTIIVGAFKLTSLSCPSKHGLSLIFNALPRKIHVLTRVVEEIFREFSLVYVFDFLFRNIKPRIARKLRSRKD